MSFYAFYILSFLISFSFGNPLLQDDRVEDSNSTIAIHSLSRRSPRFDIIKCRLNDQTKVAFYYVEYDRYLAEHQDTTEIFVRYGHGNLYSEPSEVLISKIHPTDQRREKRHHTPGIYCIAPAEIHIAKGCEGCNMMCLQIFELDFDNKADVSIFLVKCPGHTKNIHDCWFNKNAHRKCRAEDKTS